MEEDVNCDSNSDGDSEGNGGMADGNNNIKQNGEQVEDHVDLKTRSISHLRRGE